MSVAFPGRDPDILRSLAGRVADIAARPEQQEKRDLWYRHNALEPTRPLVFCDPENGWHEIITPGALECTDPLAREWEWWLRRQIFWGDQMRDDRVIEPWFEVGTVASDTGWGVPIERHGGTGGGAFTWRPPIASYAADLPKLRVPRVIVDEAETGRRMQIAHELFDGVLSVRRIGFWWWSLGMTEMLVYMRGLEQMMIDMIDAPQNLHRLMGFLRDAHLAKLDQLETEGLLTPNHDGAYVGSGGFGYTRELPAPDFAGRTRTRDMWGFAESQETTAVSPAMFEEFIFPYQVPLLERFGLNCYGCCEPLHKRWHVVKRFPRLRRISVSPWADLAVMAENLGADYVYSMKPNPAPLARPAIDEPAIREGLRSALEITRGCRVEVIMKDNHTIGNNPGNVTRWTRIAMEEAERIG